MKNIEAITLGTTVICLMGLPTYIGFRLNHVIVGIVVAFISTISYILYIVVKKK